MREKNRKSIARLARFPQFTTMNVIDGQAGLVICASLIFYSLTINNILNIIVLLILAGVTIATLTGENGILTRAKSAKTVNEKAAIKEQLELAVQASRMQEGVQIDLDILDENVVPICGRENIAKQGKDDQLPWQITKDGYIFQITEDGNVISVEGISLDNTELKLLAGETKKLTATKTEGTEGTVEWSSSDESIVTVTSDGSVTVKEGTIAGSIATITAKVNGTEYKAECKVTIISTLSSSTTVTALEVAVRETKKINLDTASLEDLTYSSSDTTKATVDNEGNVTGVAVGNAIITITGKTSGNTATCNVTVKQGESDWNELAALAEKIVNDPNISESTETTVTVDGKTLTVGDSYYAMFDGILKRVRILGFKHDDVVDNEENVTGKAGISFEFVTTLGSAQMNTEKDNTAGWEEMPLRTKLNGDSYFGKLSSTLQSKIKTVKKAYNKGNNSSAKNEYTNDKLWCLSFSEVFGGNVSSYNPEGTRYAYYVGKSQGANIVKYSTLTSSLTDSSTAGWWLRSPYYNSSYNFYYVDYEGYNGFNWPINDGGVAPGFSI